MRIISPFRDYYDSVLAYGHDEHGQIYHRVTKIIDDVPPQIESLSMRDVFELRYYRSSYCHPVYIGFCGKIYPMMTLRDDNDKERLYHSVAAVEEHVEKFYSKKSAMCFCTSPSKSWWDKNPQSPHQKVRDFFMSCESLDFTDAFVSLATPIFSYRNAYKDNGYRNKSTSILTINPCLQDDRFMKVLDPYTAFGEIDMFFGGVLCNTEDNTIQIDDKHMLQQKGFDKFSFKKPPTKKR